jgi:putative ABC transport system permease protein
MRRAVAALLHLFPAEFRRAFGRDMLADFDDRWRERRGVAPAIRIILNLLCAAALERLSPRPHGALPPKGDSRMETLLQDVSFATRTLMRGKGFALAAIATLALGIGVNTAMFSVAHAVLWRSLPFPDPDRVVMVGEVDARQANVYWGVSYPSFLDWRARSTSFEHLAGALSDERVLREGAEPVRIPGQAVSHDFFAVMGVAPALGRVFGDSDDRQGAPPVVVLSHRMWVSRFGADPAILGRSIRLGGPVTVIGVMPAGFEYAPVDFWTPLDQVVNPYFRRGRAVWVMQAIGRLRPGVTQARAQTEVESIAAGIRCEFPEARRGQMVRVNPMRAELSRDLRPALLVLLGAVALVLLIACGNLAGLMLVKGSGRAREMAIRGALGVSGGRLMQQLLTESALLAGAGGLTGMALAWWATRALALLTKDPRLLDVPIDIPVLLFAAAATLATTLLFGITPAIRAMRTDVSDALKSGARVHASRERTRMQRVLVVAEVALCLVLLAGAGLLFRSFRKVLDVQPGFRTENLVAMRIGLPRNYLTEVAITQFYQRASERLAALPGVSGATLASRLPLSGGEPNGDITIEGRPSNRGELGTSTFRQVMPNYFEAMGIPLRRGRAFDVRDDGSRGRPIIINEGFARHFWPHGDPIGARIKIGPREASDWSAIVGVAGDVRQLGLDSEPPFSIYEPLLARSEGTLEIAVRAAGNPRNLIASIRGALRALDPALVVDKVATMSQRIDESVAPRRLNVALFGLFAGLALLLAALGLYGVVAYSASQRTQEFGIRMALGARSGDVLRLVLGQGLKLAALGVLLGTAAALALARLLKSLLFQIDPNDPWTLATVAILLTIVAGMACWLPARRAMQVAPVEALRSE